MKVGDRISVIDKPPKDKCEDPTWVEEMTCYCGMEGNIVRINNPYFEISVDKGRWTWDEKWLIPIEDEGELEVGQIVQIIYEPPTNRMEGPSWVDGMSQYCGQTVKITRIESSGYYVVESMNGRKPIPEFVWKNSWLVPLGLTNL